MSIVLFATVIFLAGMVAGFGIALIIKGITARPSKYARRNKAMPRQRGVTRI